MRDLDADRLLIQVLRDVPLQPPASPGELDEPAPPSSAALTPPLAVSAQVAAPAASIIARPASPTRVWRPPPPAEYLITVATSDKVGATADCAVRLVLEGEGGALEHVLPAECPAVSVAVPKGGQPSAAMHVSVPMGDLGNLFSITLSLMTDTWGVHHKLLRSPGRVTGRRASLMTRVQARSGCRRSLTSRTHAHERCGASTTSRAFG